MNYLYIYAFLTKHINIYFMIHLNQQNFWFDRKQCLWKPGLFLCNSKQSHKKYSHIFMSYRLNFDCTKLLQFWLLWNATDFIHLPASLVLLTFRASYVSEVRFLAIVAVKKKYIHKLILSQSLRLKIINIYRVPTKYRPPSPPPKLLNAYGYSPKSHIIVVSRYDKIGYALLYETIYNTTW